jgi:hypothetical protein
VTIVPFGSLSAATPIRHFPGSAGTREGFVARKFPFSTMR